MTQYKCTRPPTCEGNCENLKYFGNFVASSLCAGPGATKLVQKLTGAAEGKAGSVFLFAIPGFACGWAFDRAADEMYRKGDSFTTCVPIPGTGQGNQK